MTKLTVAKSNLANANARPKKSPFARFEVLTAVKMSSALGRHAVSTGTVADVSR
jgi:hypothetical protein